jgi:hypothetical protein
MGHFMRESADQWPPVEPPEGAVDVALRDYFERLRKNGIGKSTKRFERETFQLLSKKNHRAIVIDVETDTLEPYILVYVDRWVRGRKSPLVEASGELPHFINPELAAMTVNETKSDEDLRIIADHLIAEYFDTKDLSAPDADDGDRDEDDEHHLQDADKRERWEAENAVLVQRLRSLYFDIINRRVTSPVHPESQS